jgi:hypothetical protein
LDTENFEEKLTNANFTGGKLFPTLKKEFPAFKQGPLHHFSHNVSSKKRLDVKNAKNVLPNRVGIG